MKMITAAELSSYSMGFAVMDHILRYGVRIDSETLNDLDDEYVEDEDDDDEDFWPDF